MRIEAKVEVASMDIPVSRMAENSFAVVVSSRGCTWKPGMVLYRPMSNIPDRVFCPEDGTWGSLPNDGVVVRQVSAGQSVTFTIKA